MTSSDRHFPNTLPDEPSEQFYDLNSKRLTGRVKEEATASANQLLQLLDRKLRTNGEVDLSDYSVYTGTAGYALTYYLLFRKLNDPLLLTRARDYSNVALKQVSSRSPRISFLCGVAGPWTVAALVSDLNEAKEWIAKVVSLHSQAIDINSGDPDELLYGRCGYLYSLLLLRQELAHASSALIKDDHIRSLLSTILASGTSTALSLQSRSSHNEEINPPLFYFWHDSPYVGAAHGFAGILYLLLKCYKMLTEEELLTLVKPTVDYLLSIRFPSGNTPSSVGREHDKLVHWCHGAPGVIYTQIEAYKVFRDLKYLTAAMQSADVIWQRGLLRKGYGICHGTAGNGYAFLALFNLTHDPIYLHRALQFSRFCGAYGSHPLSRQPDRPWSLFEGLAGTVVYMFDILNPLQALFPAYQLN